MMRLAVPLSVLLLALSGCAQKVALQPAAGKQLPPAPYGAKLTPSADALLVPPAQAVPVRRVELRSRSEERADDPFDLPPE